MNTEIQTIDIISVDNSREAEIEVIEWLWTTCMADYEHYYIIEKNQFLYYDSELGYFRYDKEDSWIKAMVKYKLDRINVEGISANRYLSIHQKMNIIKNYKFDHSQLARHYKDIHTTFNRFAKRVTKDDMDIIFINVLNGVIKYDLITEEIELVDNSPTYEFLSVIVVNYNPAAKCPTWMKAVPDVIPSLENQNYFYHYLAYTLMDGNFDWQACLMLWGAGHNGKGTITRPWKDIFNSVSHAMLHQIASKHGGSTLVDKDLIYAGESNEAPVNTSILKLYIAGEEVPVEPKGVDIFDVVVTGKIIVVANNLPNLTDRSEKRRFIIIQCPNYFDKNDQTDLEQKLRDEIEGFFNYILQYIPKYVNNIATLKAPLKERNDEIMEHYTDPLQYFVENYLYYDQNSRVMNAELKIALECYYKHHGLEVPTIHYVTSQLKREYLDYGTRINDGSDRGWQNVALNEQLLIEDVPSYEIKRYQRSTPKNRSLDELFTSTTPSQRQGYIDRIIDLLKLQNGPIKSAELRLLAHERWSIPEGYVSDLLKEMKKNGDIMLTGNGIVLVR